MISEINFPDHYQYTAKDINKIKSAAKNLNAKIITTEKDYVKIDTKSSSGINFIKIDIIIKNENELIDFIKIKI